MRVNQNNIIQKVPTSTEAILGRMNVVFNHGVLRPADPRDQRALAGLTMRGVRRMVSLVFFYGHAG